MKDKFSAVLIAHFGGFIGLHKFYLGKVTSGILYAIFFWTFIPFILSRIDMLYYLFKDKDEFCLKYGASKVKKAKVESSDRNYSLLAEAKRLFDDGALTQEEFNLLKKNILG